MRFSHLAVFGLLSIAEASILGGEEIADRRLADEFQNVELPAPDRELWPSCAGTLIDFDDSSAPCLFAETVPLSNEFLATGVTFSGPAAHQGGAVLNQCGNFGVNGQSSPNFLAFNSHTYGVSPQTMVFANPADFVQIMVGSSLSGLETTLECFLGGTSVGISSLVPSSALAPLVFTGAPFDSCVLDTVRKYGNGRIFWVADDLCFDVIDTDGDGVPDGEDNCKFHPNSNQADDDHDGIGNVCDNCPFIANSGQYDGDDDGVGDACDNCPTMFNDNQDVTPCIEECTDPCASVISDDFENRFYPAYSPLWASAAGATLSNNCGFTSPSKALFFNGDTNTGREVVSEPILGGPGLTLSFNLIIGSDLASDAICEDADDYEYSSSSDPEDVVLEFLIDGSWTAWSVFDTENYNDFTCVEVAIPADATQFKLRQPLFTGPEFDHWAIDDVQIKSCDCCHPIATDLIEGDEAVYFAANGCEGFVACFPSEFTQLGNFGYQECVEGLLWNGEDGSDGLDADCLGPAAVTCDGYCVIGDWEPPMPPMGCCSDGVDGNFPIGDCSHYVQCHDGIQSVPMPCPVGLLFKPTEWGGHCDWPEYANCVEEDNCMPMGPGLDRRLGEKE